MKWNPTTTPHFSVDESPPCISLASKIFLGKIWSVCDAHWVDSKLNQQRTKLHETKQTSTDEASSRNSNVEQLVLTRKRCSNSFPLPNLLRPRFNRQSTSSCGSSTSSSFFKTKYPLMQHKILMCPFLCRLCPGLLLERSRPPRLHHASEQDAPISLPQGVPFGLQ